MLIRKFLNCYENTTERTTKKPVTITKKTDSMFRMLALEYYNKSAFNFVLNKILNS